MRKKLIEAGVDSFEHETRVDCNIKNKIIRLRGRGDSYQVIADKFNLWLILTRSGVGKWHSKTVREISYYR